MGNEHEKETSTHENRSAMEGKLDSLSRSSNILLSRALGSTVGCICLGALYLLLPTIDRIVANYREIRMVEVDCVRCHTQLNYCSSDLKQSRAELLQCKG